LTPAELPALAGRDLSHTACVVFDILRATSTFVTALHHGATTIVPVSDIAAAVARRHSQPEVLLAGERDGIRITAGQTGSLDFDLGNSPREFTPKAVSGRTIVSTTTNGTRALRACIGAQTVLAGAFLNLSATAKHIHWIRPENVLLVCAGTGEGLALEDVLAAGALAEQLTSGIPTPARSDATDTARHAFLRLESNLATALGSSRNGKRLLAIPGLHDDVAFCAQLDVLNLVATMNEAGCLTKL